jgi:hypothetical protein
MLTRFPGLEKSRIKPFTPEVLIDGEEITHRECSLIALEEHRHKPPEKGAPEYSLALFGWD